MDPASDEKTHTVLWTAGWDSTFRILDLILVENEAVQPIYVIDEGRASTSLELKAMDRIRAMVLAREPRAKELLKPTKIFRRAEIAPSTEISRAYLAMKDRQPLGRQYEWLGWLAEQENFAQLELGVHKGDHFTDFLSSDEMAVFRRFSLPLVQVTKVEMGEYAAKHRFADILEHTWFCHLPLRGKPCGRCVPCRQTREAGLAWRVPQRSFFDRVLFSFAAGKWTGLVRRLQARKFTT